MPHVVRKYLSRLLKALVGLLEEQSPATAIALMQGDRSRMTRLEDKVDQIFVSLATTNTKVNILMSIAFTLASAYIYSLFQ